jgi:hypothetical protein
MPATTGASVRLGGMAMPDGVYIRSERAWALARADGTVASGPISQTPLRRVPLLRVLMALGSGLSALARSARERGPSSTGNRRFVVLLVVMSALHWWASRRLGFDHGWARSVADPAFALMVLVAMRLLLPARLWRHHGAEHKAIAAYESGVDLGDRAGVRRVPAVHDRCGTNLVALLFLFTAMPLPTGPAGVLIPVAMVAMLAEVLGSAVRLRPRSRLTRALVAPGRLLQRAVTVREPDDAELAIGLRAVEACLAEHRAVASGQVLASAT